MEITGMTIYHSISRGPYSQGKGLKAQAFTSPNTLPSISYTTKPLVARENLPLLVPSVGDPE